MSPRRLTRSQRRRRIGVQPISSSVAAGLICCKARASYDTSADGNLAAWPASLRGAVKRWRSIRCFIAPKSVQGKPGGSLALPRKIFEAREETKP